MSEENTPTELPTVGGRRIATSNAAFERACLVKLMHEQEKLDCDSSLLNLLCESVRLVREYSDSMQESPSPSELEQENKRLRKEKPLPDNYQRLLDLVRYSRSELHRENLIDDDEYAQLCVIEGSPGRLCAYDDIRRQLEAVRLAKDTLRANLKDAVEALEPFVKILECTPASLSDSDSIVYLRGNLTVGDCRRAKETLQRLKEGM